MSGVRARVAHLAFWRPALRVLCYHRIVPSAADSLSVTAEAFRQQLFLLTAAGYTPVKLSDVAGREPLPARPVLITFDDGYVDTLEHAAPILEDAGFPAAVFVVTKYLGDRARWDEGGAALMDAAQLHALSERGFEIALHSHAHRRFDQLTLPDITEDLTTSLRHLRSLGIEPAKALAYPYGARPKRSMAAMVTALEGLGLQLAFRLGNRLNRLPLTDPFEVQRLIVTGEMNLKAFEGLVFHGRMP